jgi:hypothetical protein
MGNQSCSGVKLEVLGKVVVNQMCPGVKCKVVVKVAE